MAIRIKKGDKVVVITGRDKGKTGEVLRVMPRENRAIVAGINRVKRHQRQSQTQEGGIVEKEASLHLSNVSLLCPQCDKPVRVGFKLLGDGKKVRFCKKCKEIIE